MANNFKPIGGGGGGALDIPSDQVFSSNSERDTYFTANPEKLVEGAQCVVLTSPPEGLYQVYTDGVWEDRSAIIQGPKGDKGEKGDDGSDGNPGNGFTLVQNASIWATDSTGADSSILGYTVDDKLVIGDYSNTNETIIKSTDRLYINVIDSEGTEVTLGVLDDSDRVNVDGIETPNINTGPGLESVDNGDGSVTIETTGQEDVIQYNVDDDQTVNITPSKAGKFISITQTTLATKVMSFYMDDHNLFQTGDTIKITASASYVNYYFAVYYYLASGQALVIYPNNSCALVRTEDGWDIEQDGRFTKTAIRSTTKRGLPLEGDDPAGVPVQAFSFIEHPALSYIEDENGNRVIEIDLWKVVTPNFDTVDIIGWWSDNASPTESDILNAAAQVQTSSLISHTDDVKGNELPSTSIAMKREEASPKYTYFAYPAGFFTNEEGSALEPTLVNTGLGNSSDWVVSTVDVEGIVYRIQRSPAQNVSQQLLTCKLVQEGY